VKYKRSKQNISYYCYRLSIVIILALLACGVAGVSKAFNVWHETPALAQPIKTATSSNSAVNSASKTRYTNHFDQLHAQKTGSLENPECAIAVERAIAAASGLGLSGGSSGNRGQSNSSSPAHTVNTAPVDTAAPLLITESDSTRAIAFDSVTCKAEPFTVTSAIDWATGADGQTRVSLFAMNIGPSFGDPDTSSITVDAEDFTHNRYPLLVEAVSEVSGYAGLNMVVVRLDESLGPVGDVLLRIHAHGKTSNSARITIPPV